MMGTAIGHCCTSMIEFLSSILLNPIAIESAVRRELLSWGGSGESEAEDDGASVQVEVVLSVLSVTVVESKLMSVSWVGVGVGWFGLSKGKSNFKGSGGGVSSIISLSFLDRRLRILRENFRSSAFILCTNKHARASAHTYVHESKT